MSDVPAADPEDACQIAVLFDPFESTVFEQCEHGDCLIVSMLDPEAATAMQMLRGSRNNSRDVIEALRAAGKRTYRLVP